MPTILRTAAIPTLLLTLTVAATACAVPVSGPTASSAPAASGGTLARQRVTGRVPDPGSCHYRTAADGQPLPDPACTPGALDARATQLTIAETVCKKGYTALIRPPTSETDAAKRQLMLAYGTTQRGELDHLISLELGGSSDVANLWPEPGPIPNPKDAVETKLKDLVCNRVFHGAPAAYLPLQVAQHLIATDWTTAEAKARMLMVT